MKTMISFAAACSALVICAGCRRDMGQQPRYNPLQAASFFENGMASRPLPAHTIARGQLHEDELFYSGKVNGQVSEVFPEPVTRSTLMRGRERFDIYCSPCHGATGKGDGIVVRRGFPVPPSFHIDRLRSAPAGHFFEVMTNGYGVMYSYAERVDPADRWAIAAYIRALQTSQNSGLADAEPAERAKLEAMPR